MPWHLPLSLPLFLCLKKSAWSSHASVTTTIKKGSQADQGVGKLQGYLPGESLVAPIVSVGLACSQVGTESMEQGYCGQRPGLWTLDRQLGWEGGERQWSRGSIFFIACAGSFPTARCCAWQLQLCQRCLSA